ncbi:MAG: hypothetical protein BWY76_01918 [bacterium ADurb.Bin429]|nr:MAG: hypothetical protein BWY76_01918 [bacterium ADurb.Bin429]
MAAVTQAIYMNPKPTPLRMPYAPTNPPRLGTALASSSPPPKSTPPNIAPPDGLARSCSAPPSAIPTA